MGAARRAAAQKGGGKKGGGKEPIPEEKIEEVAQSGLQGANARERKWLRNAFRMSRAPGERSGAKGPATRAPPPACVQPVSGCDWGSGGSPCHCKEWPQWLLQRGIPAKMVRTCWDK